MLLANIDMRQQGHAHQSERHVHMVKNRFNLLILVTLNRFNFLGGLFCIHFTSLQIRNSTVIDLMDKIFKNYNSWCQYLHLESNIRSVCISLMCILFLNFTSLTKRTFKSQNSKGCLHTTARASLHRAVFTDLGWSF